MYNISHMAILSLKDKRASIKTSKGCEMLCVWCAKETTHHSFKKILITHMIFQHFKTQQFYTQDLKHYLVFIDFK